MGGPALVILAAGEARRFGGCKQVTPIGPAGEVLMDYTIVRGAAAGFTQAMVVTDDRLVASLNERFVDAVLPVVVVAQPDGLRGTVPALAAARHLLGEAAVHFVGVVNADDLYPPEALRALANWRGPGHAVVGFALAATLLPGTLVPSRGSVNRALCQMSGAGHAGNAGEARPLVSMVEASVAAAEEGWVATPHGGTPVTVGADTLVSMNAWSFGPSIWARLEAAMNEHRGTGEVLLPTIVGKLVASGEDLVTVLPVEASCVGLTWPEDLSPLRQFLAGGGAEL